MATRKGIWVDLPKGVKEVVDMVASIKNISRKEYCQVLIEADLVDSFEGVEVETFLEGFNPALLEAYRALVERVNARRSGAAVPVAQEEDEEYYEEADLPKELTGSRRSK